MIRARRLRLAVGVSLALALPALAQAPAPGLPAQKIAAVQTALEAAMARHGIPGLSAALVSDARVVWADGLGLADVENAVPVKPETVFRIASLTKPITATAVLQLADKGKLDLEAPIRTYVPAFPEKPWPVTSRQVLAHLGGVRHLADEEWGSTKHYLSLVDALEAFKDDPLACEPGTKPLYSTYGYCLLGCAVEAASGMKFADYLRQGVFEPAGMERVRVDDVFEVISGRARGYTRTTSGELHNSILADTSNKIPGGGLCATAADMARFAAALQSGTLLPKGVLERMFTRQKTRDGKLTEYGLGWRVGRWKGRREVWHHGGQPRVSAMLYMQPDKGLAVVLLCNLEGVAPGLLELARGIAEVVTTTTR